MSPQETAAAYERYRAEVEGLAASILRDRVEAADVASEVYLAYLESGPSDPERARAWLMASARNRSLNRIRDRASEARKGERAARAEVEPEGEPDGFGDDAAAELVRRALERLAKRDREAVVLRFLEGRSHDEVASMLGVSQAQARLIVFRAAKRLRAQTVTLLAEHHGASAACTTRLLRRVRDHGACGPCTSVVDEIAALASLGLAPPSLVALARGWMTRVAEVRERLPRTGGRLAEAITATVVIGALAAPGIAVPASGGSVARRTEASHAVAAVGVATRALDAVAAPVPAAGGARNVATVRDAANDPWAAATPMRVLGVPVSLFDTVNLEVERGVDIRAASVATLADASGAVAGVRFRVELADSVPANAAYFWHFEFADGCWGDIVAATAMDGSSAPAGEWTVSCPSSGLDDLIRPKNEWVPFDASIHGGLVDIRLAHEKLGEAAAYFSAGSTLRMITVTTSLAATPQDHAPDSGTFEYTIGS